MTCKGKFIQQTRGSVAAAFVMVFLASGALTAAGFPAGKIAFTISANMLKSYDSVYKTVYGETTLYPELRISYNVSRKFFIWSAFGFLSKEGTIAELGDKATSNQSFLSLGAGYGIRLAGKLEFRLQAGLFHAHISESAMDLTEKRNRIGWRADGSLIYPATNSLFIGATLGYLNARDTANGQAVKFGGLKAGPLLEFRF